MDTYKFEIGEYITISYLAGETVRSQELLSIKESSKLTIPPDLYTFGSFHFLQPSSWLSLILCENFHRKNHES